MKTQELVDRLGQLKARIAELAAEERQLKDRLIDLEVDAVEGLLFRANIVRTTRKAVDYKRVLERLQPSRQLLYHYTSEKQVVSVRLVSK